MSKLSLSKIWKAYFSVYLLLFIFSTDWPWGLHISCVFIFLLSQHLFQTSWTGTLLGLCWLEVLPFCSLRATSRVSPAPGVSLTTLHSCLWVSSVFPRASEWPFRRATGDVVPSVTAGPFPPGNRGLYPLFFFSPDILKLAPEALQRLTDFLTHS